MVVVTVIQHILNILMFMFTLLITLVVAALPVVNKGRMLLTPLCWLLISVCLFLALRRFWKGKTGGRRFLLWMNVIPFICIGTWMFFPGSTGSAGPDTQMLSMSFNIVVSYFLFSIILLFMVPYLLISRDVRAFFNPKSADDLTVKTSIPNPELETIHCPYCNKMISKLAKFCHGCGKILNESFQDTDFICGNCKKHIHKDALFCWNCGEGIP